MVDGDPQQAEAAPGRIHVRLEQVEGVFVEGFEVGLRFETGAGEVIAATLWSDFVSSTGRTGIDAAYDSVLTQPVPSGTVQVSAEANIGIGPGPSIPDLSGELPCTLTVEVEPDQDVAVEVGFDGTGDCLRRVDLPADPPGDPVPGTPTTPPTTAPSTSAPAPPSLAVGTSHHVDVDLECQAFELDGIWVLADGDTSTWQPPGERHEGGTFTIEVQGRGRFVGDAAGEKTGIFERLDHGGDPPCAPVPRAGR